MKDFIIDYNIDAGITGAAELSENEVSYDVVNGRYQVTDSNGVTLLFGDKFDGGACSAPVSQSMEFMRSATAIYLAINGTNALNDFLGGLSSGVIFAGRITSNYTFAGNMMFKVTLDNNYYYFTFSVIA